MSGTRIEWTDRTLELVSGCTKVSTGCKNCYAERLANGRLNRFYPHGFGDIRIHPERFELPLRWQKPSRIFVCSRSDLFHEAVPYEFLMDAFEVMAQAEHHIFQVLTKRPERMWAFLRELYNTDLAPPGASPYPNIWLGVSVENQETAKERIPLLVETPAPVHFLSAEPLLGPLDLRQWLLRCICGEKYFDDGCGGHHHYCPVSRHNFFYKPGLDWVIVGAESGTRARWMDENWVRSIRDHCRAASVPFFYKQKLVNGNKVSLPELDGQVWAQLPSPTPTPVTAQVTP